MANMTAGQKQAFNHFVNSGYTPKQAAGLVGMLQGETGKNLTPGLIGDGGLAKGIAQMHPARWAAQAAWAQSVGLDPYSTDPEVARAAQLAMITHELEAGTVNEINPQAARIKGIQEAGDVAKAGVKHYEKPRDTIGEMNARAKYADAIQSAYQSTPVPQDYNALTAAVDNSNRPQPSVQTPHPDTSVNPYGGLLGGLGAGVTAAIQAANGIGNVAKSIGGLFSPGQQPSVSLPNHPQTPTPLAGIGPVGPVSYGGSLGAIGVNAPHTPTPSTAYSGSGYQSTAGSNNPYQGSSRPYESGYTPGYSQLAPGAATATQMFGADPNPVAAAKPSFTTTRSLNPNYEKEMAAYNAYQSANVPSAVDSFMESPSLSAVTPGTFESAFPSAPRPATPAPAKPQQYVTKQVQSKPFSPSFAAGTPVMDAIGNIVGAMGLNGKAFTPSFAPGTSITDQNGNVVGSMTGQGMQTQKPSIIGGLMSALGIGANITGNGAYQTSNSKAYGPTTYGTQSYQGGSHSTLGGGDGHRAL